MHTRSFCQTIWTKRKAEYDGPYWIGVTNVIGGDITKLGELQSPEKNKPGDAESAMIKRISQPKCEYKM